MAPTPTPSPSASASCSSSSSSSSSSASAPLDGRDLPPLVQGILRSQTDQEAAMRLVADSIAQQRQLASRAILYHPATLSFLAVALAVIWRRSGASDLGTGLMLSSAVLMTVMLATRWATSGYISRAEAFSWRRFVGEDDVVIGIKFGDVMVGALVLGIDELECRGSIRAWTTELRYRRRGVGLDLLREAVRTTRRTCGYDSEIVFAADHANSGLVLPEMFNRSFRQRETDAERALRKALARN